MLYLCVTCHVIGTLNTMPQSEYPEWVMSHKRLGTEIRLIRGKYYVYQCSSYYDKESKRTRKKTGDYLGRITEAEGFVAKKEAKVSTGKGIRDGECATLEYGFYHFYTKCIKDCYEPLLRKHFPDLWQSILGASYCRAMRQAPLNRMEAVFRRSYFSHVYQDAHLSPRNLTGLLRDLGRSRDAIISFCRELLGESRTIIFDGTDIVSASQLMTVNSLQKSKVGSFDRLFNMMCVFSPDARIPVFYSIHPGKLKDAKSFKDSLDELMIDKDKTLVVIDPDMGTELDKGFASGSNLEKLEEFNLNYVVSLRRNDRHLNYDCLNRRDNSDMDVQFEYEGRSIWGKDLGEWDEEHPWRKVYLFYDPILAKKEELDFAKHHHNIMGSEKYRKKYAESSLKFGTIAMVSNKTIDKKKDKKTGKEKGHKLNANEPSLHEIVYFSYKERGTDEDMISTLKTVVKADRTYMQDEIAVEGWMFVNFLALLWHYLIRDHIEDCSMLKRYSSSFICDTFTGVNVLRIGNQWKLSGITANDQRTLRKLKLLPPIDRKFIVADDDDAETETDD